MFVIRRFTVVLILFVTSSCSRVCRDPWQEIATIDINRTPNLVGRWKSDTVPTGYWIIDRYADGRYAQKYYLAHSFDEPHEIVLVWGRWKLDGNLYQNTIEGTNSDFLRRFVGRSNEKQIKRRTHDDIVFDGREGDRDERRVSVTTSLPLLKLPVPNNSKDGWLPSKHGIVEPKADGVPSWLYEKPAFEMADH